MVAGLYAAIYESLISAIHFQSFGIMPLQRRFLISSSVARLIQREKGVYRQVEGFFPTQGDRLTFVHLEENRAFLILQTSGPNGEAEDRTEVPTPHAHALLDVCAGEVDYARTKLPIGSYTALVDHIMRPCLLHLVTVEFGSLEEARAFRPLEWFGPEVTGQARFTNQGLALNGLSEAPDVPLSNATLNSLIDTLDNRFPAQARMPINPPKAKQDQGTRASAGPASGSGHATEVSLEDIEEAMTREMGLAMRNKPTS
ncbi:CYTH domain-containing protein [Microvirga guangxiensis]|uniref:CYTH domain-containing protein n=2 Tax=Microvirga guangxiensis TaxID=549386 RepID=A0A1G5KH61_9HYPH|nr:CYTH domain-containing protein [Microvirga guangxiensis]